MTKKKSSKNEQFFFGLRDTVYPLVNIRLDNAKEIFSQPDIDGGLIGGAALKLEDFSKIIEGFNS
mgnify:CR=1 FL=1